MGYFEFRCSSCKKLLFKGVVVEGIVEIKCRSCHMTNTITASEQAEYLCMIKNCPGRIPLVRHSETPTGGDESR